MAFSTSNVRTGTAGDLKMIAGDWTGQAGDAPGTMTVAGGRIYLASFNGNASTPTVDEEAVGISGPSSGLMTVSVYYHENVTAGQFLIIYG